MNLSNAARVDLQFELEALALEMGVRKYREALAADGLGAVSAGQALIKAAVRPLDEALKTWLEATGGGLASRSAGVYHFINQLETEAVAWLTAHSALALLHERPSVTKVAILLALQLESAINMDALAAANPALANKMAKRLKTINTAKNRLVFIRKGAVMVDVRPIQWDGQVRLRVGTLLLEMFTQSTGLVAIDNIQVGRNHTSTIMRPTESCMKWLEVSHARCELLSPVRMPMVCRPRTWTNPFNGGYLTKNLRQAFVKTRNKGYLSQLKEWDMPYVYAAVNALQETEWAVNTEVFELVRLLQESSREIGGLPTHAEVPMPAKSWAESDTPDPDVLHAWKVDASRVYEARAKLESKRLQLIQKVWTAEKMVEHGNRFHFVYNMDWRGRLYPVGSGLNPQGDDVAKSMLRFANGVALGDDGAYWLAIHTANSYGVDKVSFDERIQWVEDHTQTILHCGRDPLVNLYWTEADQPFVFLAACMEYAKLDRWVAAGGDQETFQSNLPVAFDGSCNGLQNFSAMLKDEVGGAATGLIPSHKPSDIYTEVAKAAQAIIDRDSDDPGCEHHMVAERWRGKMTRKLAKRNTMTVPYGVTRRGMRDQLFGELQDSAPHHRAADADYLAQCNFEAIGNVVVAARLAMDWLREAAKVAASNKLPVRWETPMGLLVVQDYRQEEGDMADFTVLGRRYQLLLQRTGDKLNTRKQALGISPNFVHSLDAAHLMRTVLHCAEDGVVDFAMIHDSYGTHAGKASLLRDNLRAAFVDQYSTPVLERFRDELLEQLPEELRKELPPLPPMGSLDLEQVRTSEYFFA